MWRTFSWPEGSTEGHAVVDSRALACQLSDAEISCAQKQLTLRLLSRERLAALTCLSVPLFTSRAENFSPSHDETWNLLDVYNILRLILYVFCPVKLLWTAPWTGKIFLAYFVILNFSKIVLLYYIVNTFIE